MARPTKLNETIQTEIEQLLQKGNFVDTVCDFVGIARETYYDWLRRGERGWQSDIDSGYVKFSDTIKKAIAKVETETVTELRDGPQNWQAKAWWLERRHPDKWGNRQRQTNTNVNVDLSELPDDDLERLARGEEIDYSAIARRRRA